MPSPWGNPALEIKPGGRPKYCNDRSVDEGRHIAMRWLIEFVGIADTRVTKEIPDRPKPKRKKEAQQVMINRFKGGDLFDNTTTDAKILSKLWKGCTQASSHPTIETGHPDIDPPDLAKGLVIIIAHLEKTIYAKNGYDLLDVVQKQENRDSICHV